MTDLVPGSNDVNDDHQIDANEEEEPVLDDAVVVEYTNQDTLVNTRGKRLSILLPTKRKQKPKPKDPMPKASKYRKKNSNQPSTRGAWKSAKELQPLSRRTRSKYSM